MLTAADSDFTSGLQRLKALRDQQPQHSEQDHSKTPAIMPLNDQSDNELPLSERSYLELLDFSGRIIKEGKAGFIAETQPPILTRLNMTTDQWRLLCKDFESPFRQFVGSYQRLKEACKALGKTSLHGLGSEKRLFSC